MSKNKKVYIPIISKDVNTNIDTIITQAGMLTSTKSMSNEVMTEFSKMFRKSIKDKLKVNEVFWSLIDYYFGGGYKRPNIIRIAIHLFKPYEFLVYQLINNGEIVYIGKTDRSHSRMMSHVKDKEFNQVKYYLCSDTNEQDLIENTCILTYKPKYNKSVRLSCVLDGNELPEFLPVDRIVPDFIPISGGAGKIPVTDNHYYIEHLGFVRKDKVSNTPYWFSKEHSDFLEQKERLKFCKELLNKESSGILKKGCLAENFDKFQNFNNQIRQTLLLVTDSKFTTSKLGILDRLDHFESYFSKNLIDGVEIC